MDDRTLHTLNVPFIEDLVERYRRDPASVPEGFRRWFEETGVAELPPGGPSFRPRGLFEPVSGPPGPDDLATASLQDRADQLIRAYRVRGHLVADLDPLGRPRPPQPELDPAFYGFTAADMDRVFSTRTIFPHQALTLRGILEHKRNTYCRTIGVQFMHLDDLAIKDWLQQRMEGTENRCTLTRAEQIRILTRLTDAVLFEEFIQKKYLGAKSFSLEGAETLIPLLDLAIERAGEQRIEDIVIGMAHRGRLNVLSILLGKSPRRIFQEFEGGVMIYTPTPSEGYPGNSIYVLFYSGNQWQRYDNVGSAAATGSPPGGRYLPGHAYLANIWESGLYNGQPVKNLLGYALTANPDYSARTYQVQAGGGVLFFDAPAARIYRLAGQVGGTWTQVR